MAEDFSYAGDVAPMESKFFGGSRYVSDSQKLSRTGSYLDRRLAASEGVIKANAMRDAEKMRALQYENSLLSLEEQRAKMAREKSVFEEMPSIQKELENIVADPDEARRLRRLSEFGIRRASLITDSPVVAQAYRSASYSTNRGSQPRASLTFGDAVRSGLNPEELGFAPGMSLEDSVDSFKYYKALQTKNEGDIRYDAQVKQKAVDDKVAAEDQDRREKAWEDTNKALNDTFTDVDEIAHTVVKRFSDSPDDEARFWEGVAQIDANPNKEDRVARSAKKKKYLQEFLAKKDPFAKKASTTDTPSKAQTTVDLFN